MKYLMIPLLWLAISLSSQAQDYKRFSLVSQFTTGYTFGASVQADFKIFHIESIDLLVTFGLSTGALVTLRQKMTWDTDYDSTIILYRNLKNVPSAMILGWRLVLSEKSTIQYTFGIGGNYITFEDERPPRIGIQKNRLGTLGLIMGFYYRYDMSDKLGFIGGLEIIPHRPQDNYDKYAKVGGLKLGIVF